MNYTLIEEIGRGGMGCVYKAKDASGHLVALKMMSNKVTCFPEYRDLFNSEVDTLRRLDHPSVVHIVGSPYQDASGNLFLPMEFIEGETLEHYILKRGRLAPDEAVRLMRNILEVMQYVHDRQKIHRDIKPSNIMLRRDGSVCVIDFGIAKDAKIGTGNTVGRIIGTDGYMSPEQADGLNIDTRTDIYSLGCVLYYMLTGKQAIVKGANDYETINTILRFQVRPPSTVVAGIPPHVDKAVMKAMDKNMTLRYRTAADFRNALAGSPDVSLPSVTIGSAADNDIVIHNEYVSRHHLVINGVTQYGAPGDTCHMLEIIDNSTNKTAVNGCPLHRSSMRVPYNGTLNLPQILLAARSECPVDWRQVVSLLKARGWNPERENYVITGGEGEYAPVTSASRSNLFLILGIAAVIIVALILLLTK